MMVTRVHTKVHSSRPPLLARYFSPAPETCQLPPRPRQNKDISTIEMMEFSSYICTVSSLVSRSKKTSIKYRSSSAIARQIFSQLKPKVLLEAREFDYNMWPAPSWTTSLKVLLLPSPILRKWTTHCAQLGVFINIYTHLDIYVDVYIASHLVWVEFCERRLEKRIEYFPVSTLIFTGKE